MRYSPTNGFPVTLIVKAILRNCRNLFRRKRLQSESLVQEAVTSDSRSFTDTRTEPRYQAEKNLRCKLVMEGQIQDGLRIYEYSRGGLSLQIPPHPRFFRRDLPERMAILFSESAQEEESMVEIEPRWFRLRFRNGEVAPVLGARFIGKMPGILSQAVGFTDVQNLWPQR